MKQIRKTISVFVPHPGAHLDEAVALELIHQHPEGKIHWSKRPIVKPMALEGDAVQYLEKGWLPIGQCNGFVLNDKDRSGKRLLGHCTASRVVDFLGIRKFPEVRRLVEAVGRVDEFATANAMDLSSLMKVRMAAIPSDAPDRAVREAEVVNWARLAIRAILQDLKDPTWADESLDPVWLFRQCPWSFEDPRIVVQIEKWLSGTLKDCENVIGLGFILRAMDGVGQDREVTENWLRDLLEDLIIQQQEYWRAHQELDKAQVMVFKPSWRRKDIRLMAIVSDNRRISVVSRSDRYGVDITVVQRRHGNMAVNVNNRAGLDMSGVWALIRGEEARLAGIPSNELAFETCLEVGNHPCVPQWHMMESGAALNGTDNIPQTPTKIPLERLVELIQTGLEPEQVRRQFGQAPCKPKPLPQQRPATKPDPEAVALRPPISEQTQWRVVFSSNNICRTRKLANGSVLLANRRGVWTRFQLSASLPALVCRECK